MAWPSDVVGWTSRGAIRLAGLLRDLPVNLDNETASQAWTATARLAERYRSPSMTQRIWNWPSISICH